MHWGTHSEGVVWREEISARKDGGADALASEGIQESRARVQECSPCRRASSAVLVRPETSTPWHREVIGQWEGGLGPPLPLPAAPLSSPPSARRRPQQLPTLQVHPQTGFKPDTDLSVADRSDSPLKTVFCFVLPRVGSSSLERVAGGGESCGLQCWRVVGRPLDYNAMTCWHGPTFWPRRPPMPCRVS